MLTSDACLLYNLDKLIKNSVLQFSYLSNGVKPASLLHFESFDDVIYAKHKRFIVI